MLLPFSSEVCEKAEGLNSFAVEQLHYSEQSFQFSISITVMPLFGRVPWLDASWDSTTLIFFIRVVPQISIHRLDKLSDLSVKTQGLC